MDSYVTYNLYEAVFWIAVGVICYFGSKYLPCKYKKILISASLILPLFGLSDLVEIKTQGFLYPVIWWLLMWKIISVILIMFLIVWYLKLRLQK